MPPPCRTLLRLSHRPINASFSSQTPLPLPFLYQTRSLSQREPARPPPPRARPTSDRSASADDDDAENIPFDASTAAAAAAAQSVEDDPFGYLYNAAAAAEPVPPPRFASADARKPTQWERDSRRRLDPVFAHGVGERGRGGGGGGRRSVPLVSTSASAAATAATAAGKKKLQQPSTLAAESVSTITLREREIFSRIFDEILAQPKDDSPPTTTTSQKTPAKPAPKSVSALFDSAVGNLGGHSTLSFGPDAAEAAAIAAYPSSLRAAAWQAIVGRRRRAEASGAAQHSAVPSPAQKAEQKAQEAALKRERSKLIACATDLDVLHFLEQRVFARAPGVKNNTSDSGGSGGSRGATSYYAELIATAMWTLRKQFNDYASAVWVFSKVKMLGAESYVMGASTEVYNQVLKAVWIGYRDSARVDELLEEMHVNGIEGDDHTFDILSKIVRHQTRIVDLGPAHPLWFREVEKVRDRILAAALKMRKSGLKGAQAMEKKTREHLLQP